MPFHASTLEEAQKRFEHEAVRPSIQTSSKEPSKYYCNEKNMCDRYACILYLIFAHIALKTSLKH